MGPKWNVPISGVCLWGGQYVRRLRAASGGEGLFGPFARKGFGAGSHGVPFRRLVAKSTKRLGLISALCNFLFCLKG